MVQYSSDTPPTRNYAAIVPQAILPELPPQAVVYQPSKQLATAYYPTSTATYKWGVANLALSVIYFIGLVISFLLFFGINLANCFISVEAGIFLLLWGIVLHVMDCLVVALGICAGLSGTQKTEKLSWKARFSITTSYLTWLSIMSAASLLFFICTIIPPSVYAGKSFGDTTFYIVFGVFGSLGIATLIAVGIVLPILMLIAAIGQTVSLYKLKPQ